jgi:hypothetical protein
VVPHIGKALSRISLSVSERSAKGIGNIVAIKLATGLHAYLTQFLERVNVLGGRISREFLMPQVG